MIDEIGYKPMIINMSLCTVRHGPKFTMFVVEASAVGLPENPKDFPDELMVEGVRYVKTRNYPEGLTWYRPDVKAPELCVLNNPELSELSGDKLEAIMAQPVSEAQVQGTKERVDTSEPASMEAGRHLIMKAVEEAAMKAHEANRAYCQSVGDDSQPAWCDAPNWQRESAIQGALAVAKNPDTTPEQSHEGWLAQKQADGWTYGPVKDSATKQHPCMVPYANLPEVQRKKDELFLETVKASFATYSPWAAQSVNEAQVQGTKERVDRRTRLPKITPATPKFDLTPHKPADNDPTKTARGRMAVKQRGKQNKRHAKKFVKEDLNLMAESTDADAAVIASAFEDPIAALIEAKKVGDTRLTSVIKNVWEGMPLERYAGMAKEGDLDGELAVFDHAVTLREDMGLTGNDFCWIERIRKPGGMVIYKTCSDKTPSDVYAESKESMDRDLILSVDRANIIRIVHGD